MTLGDARVGDWVEVEADDGPGLRRTGRVSRQVTDSEKVAGSTWLRVDGCDHPIVCSQDETCWPAEAPTE